MKKIFKKISGLMLGVIFVMLFLVSGVFAADVVITPQTAYDSNDLTCSYRGNTDSYIFEWSNSTQVIGTQNPLPASLTNVGDTIKCTVYSFTGTHLGEASVTILTDSVNPVNHAPVAKILLPLNGSRFTVGSSISFEGSATDSDSDVLATSWNFGDGNTNYSNNNLKTTHTFTTAGTYHVVLTANDGKLTDSIGQDSIDVIVTNNNNNIDIVNSIQTYTDKYVHSSDTFFRGKSLYAKFNVKNLAGVPVNELNTEAYLFNPITNTKLDLDKFSGYIKGIGFILNGQPIFRKNGNYYFELNNIPLDDNMLGQDTLLVVVIRDADNAHKTSKSQKTVYVLNNPLQFNTLPDLNLETGSSATLNLNDYVSDIETSDSGILFSVSGENKIKLTINPLTHIATFTTDARGVSERFTFSASDGDGSVVTRTMTVKVGFGPDYTVSDRPNKFAFMQGTPHDFSFVKVAPLVYKQTYKAGSDVKMIFELANKGVVDEDLELQIYIPGMQEYQHLGSLHLNVGENAIITSDVSLPSKLATGVSVMQVIASNKDNVQKINYWTFVITH